MSAIRLASWLALIVALYAAGVAVLAELSPVGQAALLLAGMLVCAYCWRS